MHQTTSGEKRKALRKEALELAMQSRAAMKAAAVLPQAGLKARELQEEADRLRAEALKDRARLEDLSLWTMEKVKSSKKGSRTYYYWMATLREGSCAQDGFGCSSAEGQGHEGRCPRNQDLNIEECRGEFQEL